MVELKNAVEKYGVDAELTRQLDCEQAPVMKGFGEMIGKLSQESNAELGRIWKLFGLRLSGKFGQHRYRTEIKHIKDIKDQTGWYPIDGSEIYHEALIYLDGHRSPFIKPAVNMRIRAEARVRHLNYLMKAASMGKIYYCDTDSVHADTEQETGKDLGQLRMIDYAVRAYYMGCKFYGYINRNDILRQKTAGFRDFQFSEYDMQRIVAGEGIDRSFKVMGNWREQLQGRGVTLVDKPRTFQTKDFGTNRLVKGTETSPIILHEL
jgi:hypothetical protein